MKALLKSPCTIFLCCFISAAGIAQKKEPFYIGILPDDSKAVMTYKNGESYVVSLPDLSVVKKLAPTIPEDKANQASLSPKGDRLVVYHNKSRKNVVWDIETGTILVEVSCPDVFVFDPSRNQMICRPNVYDLATGKLIGDFKKVKNQFQMGGIAISPDGSKLLSFRNNSQLNSYDGGVEIFDYNTGEKLNEKKGLTEGRTITSARFLTNDSIETKVTNMNAEIDVMHETCRFSILQKNTEFFSRYQPEKEMYYDTRYRRLVVKGDAELTIGASLMSTAFSPKPGWLLITSKKPDMLTLYDTKNGESKSGRGKNWKEPVPLKAVPLP